MNFLDADYSAIEARVVNWLAGQEDALAEYRQGVDRYKRMASVIYGVPEESVNKFPQRFVGKQATLGCGFGMGAPKFRTTCLKMGGYDLPEGLEDRAIKAFRATHKRVVKYWYDVEKAAKAAILKKGERYRLRNVEFLVKDLEGMPFLLIKLPSGRKLAYPKPRVSNNSIVFFGHQIGTNWGDVSTYGGKLVENCLAGDTQVLSHCRGWVDLRLLTTQDQVWDGLEFVQHQGLVDKGVQLVIEFHGLKVTGDHLFLTEEGWITAQTACMNPQIQLTSPHERKFSSENASPLESFRSKVWSFNSNTQRSWEWQKDDVDMQLQLWTAMRKNWERTTSEKPPHYRMWDEVSFHTGKNGRSKNYPRYDSASGSSRQSRDAGPLLQSESPSVAQLWGEGNQSLQTVVGVVREFLGGHGANVSAGFGHRPRGQQWGLHAGELPLGDTQTEHAESQGHPGSRRFSTRFLGHRAEAWDQTQHALLSDQSRAVVGANHQHPVGLSEQVFDIKNCGSRNQFVVRSKHRPERLLIAHNCTQAVAADIMAHGAHQAEKAGFEIATLIHDEAVCYHREGQTVEQFVKCLTDLPPWAQGLPLEAQGELIPFYKK